MGIAYNRCVCGVCHQDRIVPALRSLLTLKQGRCILTRLRKGRFESAASMMAVVLIGESFLGVRPGGVTQNSPRNPTVFPGSDPMSRDKRDVFWTREAVALSIRQTILADTISNVERDIKRWGFAGREVARMAGFRSESTLRHFLQADYMRSPQRKTIEALLTVDIWSPDTRRGLEMLRDFGESPSCVAHAIAS